MSQPMRPDQGDSNSEVTLPLPTTATGASSTRAADSQQAWSERVRSLPQPLATVLELHFCCRKSLREVSEHTGLLPRDAARLLIDGAEMLWSHHAGPAPEARVSDADCTLGVHRADPVAERLANVLLADDRVASDGLLAKLHSLPASDRAEYEPYIQVATLFWGAQETVAETLTSTPQGHGEIQEGGDSCDRLAETLALTAVERREPSGASTAAASGATDATLPVSGPPGQGIGNRQAVDDTTDATLPISGVPGSGLGAPPPPPSFPPSSSGTRPPLPSFGDYEILSVIARGGMGVVYKARQKKLNRIVALKMILSGQFADQQEIERFYVEAKAAATLRHPNIVGVHEIGEWQGQHFFSMDYIDGKSLGDLVRDQPMAPRQAADYARRIAQTVQFAHDHGIVHRDLKPSNVLVDSRGEPYVTDFGLAKQISDQSQLTVSGTIVGTPSYMPPEQAAGKTDDVGPHSDIYSLGAILYELLTGRPPFRAATPFETIRQVLQNEPVSPRLINPSVPKDLETICLKCLQKEPTRRYSSAGELAEELQRFLDGRPIKARPVSATERAWRWCRRNPWLASAFAIAALFLVVAFIGLVTAYAYRGWALRESEQSFREALRVINQFTIRVSEETLLNQPGMQPLRRDLLELALAHYQNMLERRQTDRSLRDELAGTYFRIGIITSLLDSPAKAVPHYQKAIEVYRDSLRRAPDNAAHLAGLAETLNALGTAYYATGQLHPALEQFQEAMNLRVRLTRLQPANLEFQRVLANTRMNVGLILEDQNNLSEAQQQIDTAQQLRMRILDHDPDNEKVRRDLAKGYYSLGNIQWKSGSTKEAEQSFTAAVAQLEQLLERYPNDLDNQKLLALCYRLLGDLQNVPGQAKSWYAKALDRLRSLSASNPDVTEYKVELASLLVNVGYAEYDQGAVQQAGEYWTAALNILRPLAEQYPLNRRVRLDLGTVLRVLGDLSLEQQQYPQARRYLQEAVQVLQSLADEQPQDEHVRQQLELSRESLKALVE